MIKVELLVLIGLFKLCHLTVNIIGVNAGIRILVVRIETGIDFNLLSA